MRGLVEAYRALSDIYLKKSWIDEAIKRQGDALLSDKGCFRLVYGVVEHEFLFEFRISVLTAKAPKAAIKPLLKMGMYLIEFSGLPDEVAVNEIAETAKKVGKGGVCAFLNAVLRRYVREGKMLFPTDPDERLSVAANLPLWLVKRYQREIGKERASARLTRAVDQRTHVRPSFAFGRDALAEILRERKIEYEESAHGFYLDEVGAISDLLSTGKATVMSYGSAEIAAAIPYVGGKILDMAAAPGGKSVYLAEKYGAEVLSCDGYEHRVKLIRRYAERMGVKSVTAMQADGRVLREEWRDAFSVVLLDAPCSGLGSVASNPDVVLNRKESDLAEIVKTQSELIEVAGNYVAKGGVLVYATCSDLPSEDGDVARAFLAKKDAFTLEKECYTDPLKGGGESYYYAIMRKK